MNRRNSSLYRSMRNSWKKSDWGVSSQGVLKAKAKGHQPFTLADPGGTATNHWHWRQVDLETTRGTAMRGSSMQVKNDQFIGKKRDFWKSLSNCLLKVELTITLDYAECLHHSPGWRGWFWLGSVHGLSLLLTVCEVWLLYHVDGRNNWVYRYVASLSGSIEGQTLFLESDVQGLISQEHSEQLGEQVFLVKREK